MAVAADGYEDVIFEIQKVKSGKLGLRWLALNFHKYTGDQDDFVEYNAEVREQKVRLFELMKPGGLSCH